MTLIERTESQLDLVAVEATEKIKWTPRPDMPGDTWISDDIGFGFLEVRRVSARNADDQKWVGKINGVDAVESKTPRVAMDTLARRAVALQYVGA